MGLLSMSPAGLHVTFAEERGRVGRGTLRAESGRGLRGSGRGGVARFAR